MSNLARLMQQAAAGGSVPLTYEVAGTANTTSNSNINPSFSSVSLGSLPASGFKRYIVIAEGGGAPAANADISATITVAGELATRLVSVLPASTSYKQTAAVHVIENSVDATATIAFSTNGRRRSVGLQVYAVYIPTGATLVSGDTATDSGSTSMSVALDTPSAQSLMVGVAAFRNGESTPSLSLGGTAGVTTDFRVDSSSGNENQYMGSKKFSGSNTGLTITASDATADGAESVMCGAVLYADKSDFNADYLVVGGGGGGGGSLGDFTIGTGGAGGGGGGAVISGTAGIVRGLTYSITVGAGGAGGVGGASRTSGSSGEASSFGSIATAPGGGGGGHDDSGGLNGGCGGGAGGTSTTATGGTGSVGFDGGDSLSGSNNNGGGGGGMGAAGQDGGTTAGNYGDGGDGITSSITGTSTYYGGGGGGGEGADATNDQGDGGLGGGGRGGTVNRAPQDPVAGTANTGGGGGGGADDTGTEKNGAAGGSGVVILRSLETAASTTGSPTVTTDGSYTIYTFTSSGSITY